MQTGQTEKTESAIWNRLLQPVGRTLSVAAARALLQLEFSQEDKARARELAAKARDGSLTAAENEETREYERAADLLALMKSKARLRLKTASRSNGSRPLGCS